MQCAKKFIKANVRNGKKASDEGADLKEAQLSEKYKKMYEDSLTRIKELTILNKGLERFIYGK